MSGFSEETRNASNLVLSDHGYALVNMCVSPTDCLCQQFGVALKALCGVRDTVLGKVDVGFVAFYLMSQVNVLILWNICM